MRVAGTRPCTEVLRVPPARTSTSAVMPFSAQKSSISWVCARVPTSELQRDSDLRGAGGGGGRGPPPPRAAFWRSPRLLPLSRQMYILRPRAALRALT